MEVCGMSESMRLSSWSVEDYLLVGDLSCSKGSEKGSCSWFVNSKNWKLAFARPGS